MGVSGPRLTLRCGLLLVICRRRFGAASDQLFSGEYRCYLATHASFQLLKASVSAKPGIDRQVGQPRLRTRKDNRAFPEQEFEGAIVTTVESKTPEHETVAMPPPNKKKTSFLSGLAKLLLWVVAAGCFYLVYQRSGAAAAQSGQDIWGYLATFFSGVDWWLWLGVMIPYSVFFFLVDSHATWRVVRWVNSDAVRYRDILPIRASAYILSLVNEQVGKGAMSLYLLRHHQVPGWQALSSMLMLGMVEIYQLLIFSAIGTFLFTARVVEASSMLPLDVIFPSLFALAAVYLPIHGWLFKGANASIGRVRSMPIFYAFREVKWFHYPLLLLFKAPNLLVAILVYTFALELFDVPVVLEEMLVFLPMIFLAAALPLPFHAGALVFWTVLFPAFPLVGAFSLVMHTFFVVFNAVIGLVFLPLANRQLFGTREA